MSRVKRIARALLPQLVADAVRWARGRTDHDTVGAYLSGGRVPWSPGYGEYKQRFLAEGLADASLVGKFRNGELLSAGYGLGLDECCVEYPWLLSQLNERPERMLDAGSALNHRCILDQPASS